VSRVGVDVKLLEDHRSFTDARLGVSERFVDLNLASGRTLGVLARPLGPERPVGWVVCHSFGTEQTDLQMTEVAAARRIAAGGFPVLRFHCQGYGDSEDLATPPSVASQVRDCTETVRRMPELAGVPHVGVLGARVGAMIAAITADRERLPYLVMVAPVVDGARYMREQVRSRVIAETVKRSADPTGSANADPRRTLEAGGMVSIKGWPLHGAVYRETSQLNLSSELRSFAGAAVVVQVTRNPSLDGRLGALGDRLRELGAKVEIEVVTDTAAPHFGYEHFQSPDQEVLADSLAAVNAKVAASVTEWVQRVAGTEQPR
jgi:hypothetical protein